MINNVSILAF